jgi:molybdopterin-guanine dinucleotide biosynthesis protein A
VAWCAHCGRDGASPDANLQRLFDSDFVGDALVSTIVVSANDASCADSLHARSSHENGEGKRMTFSALLLAGGESRRMGRDKATMEFEGRPLWERQLDLLRGLSPDKIFVSARSKPSWLPGDVKALIDDRPSRGPLSGLTKALAEMRTTHLIALAVDMPFLTSDELRDLSRLVGTRQGVVPLIGERAEPLAAIYPADAAEDFQTALAGSTFSLQPIIQAIAKAGKVKLWQVPKERAHFYRSVNEPGDF